VFKGDLSEQYPEYPVFDRPFGDDEKPTTVVKRLDVDLFRYSNVSILETQTETDSSGRLWVNTSWGYLCTKTDRNKTALQPKPLARTIAAWGENANMDSSATVETAMPKEQRRTAAILLRFFETAESQCLERERLMEASV
jgi:hypothetical protein